MSVFVYMYMIALKHTNFNVNIQYRTGEEIMLHLHSGMQFMLKMRKSVCPDNGNLSLQETFWKNISLLLVVASGK